MIKNYFTETKNLNEVVYAGTKKFVRGKIIITSDPAYNKLFCPAKI